MTLNEALRFEDVAASVKRAFVGAPDRVLLTPHTRLYKWTNRAALGDPVSPWWSFVESTTLPSGAVANGFRVSEERAARLRRPHREFARARAAISDQFNNSLRELLVVELNTSVWAFAGQASGQREFADSQPELNHVFLIGGGYQVWAPNLVRQHLTVVPVRA